MGRDYPAVPIKPVTDEYFGVAVEDPYRYLEVAKSAETLAVVAAENAYSERFFAEHAAERTAAIEKKLREYKPLLDIACPIEANGMICAARELPGGIQDIVRLNERYEAAEVIVDEETLGGRMHVYAAKPNPVFRDIYAVTGVIHGHPRCCCVIWDDAAKKELALLDDHFGFVWSADGKAVLYCETKVDREKQSNVSRIVRYSWQDSRREVLYTHDRNHVYIDVSEISEGLLLQTMNTYVDVEVMYLAPDGSVTSLTDGKGTWEFAGEADGRFYFTTDRGADFFRCVAVTKAQLTEKHSLLNAATVIPEGSGLITKVIPVPAGLIVQYEQDACSLLRLFDTEGRSLREIPLPDRFGCAMFGQTVLPAASAERLFFTFESFTRGKSLFMLDTRTLEIRCLRGDSGSASDITVKQEFITARDGQRILAYLVYAADLVKDGKTPVLMYGYGGYAASMPPVSRERITGISVAEWARRGRIYAHCIIRGGLEYGKAWHEAAMFDRKKNAFCDFIDIAQHLVDAGWTCPSRIVAAGCSNGGLLMSAVTTMRPDLFGVVIDSVPHTDMLRFRNDDRGMMYVTEYGDPLSSEEMFEYIRSYSPYHNIREGVVYPWVYVQTGECDNNVPPYHGKKFGVRLQKAADEAHPVLLTVLAHGSHDRGTGDEYYMNVSRIQSFIELGLEDAAE